MIRKRKRTGVYYFLETDDCQAIFPSSRRKGWVSSGMRVYGKTGKQVFSLAQKWATKHKKIIIVGRVKLLRGIEHKYNTRRFRLTEWTINPLVKEQSNEN